MAVAWHGPVRAAVTAERDLVRGLPRAPLLEQPPVVVVARCRALRCRARRSARWHLGSPPPDPHDRLSRVGPPPARANVTSPGTDRPAAAHATRRASRSPSRHTLRAREQQHLDAPAERGRTHEAGRGCRRHHRRRASRRQRHGCGHRDVTSSVWSDIDETRVDRTSRAVERPQVPRSAHPSARSQTTDRPWPGWPPVSMRDRRSSAGPLACHRAGCATTLVSGGDHR